MSRQEPLSALFSRLQVGRLSLPNRILMSPMTRGRAHLSGIPSNSMCEYYASRADAGLLISEGTCVSLMGRGWNGAPSIYTDDQKIAWNRVTDAVHKKGGRIFCQLWFLGRVSHPIFLSGAQPWGPSAIRASQHVHAPAGERLECVTPQEMSLQQIRSLIEEFATAAENAIEAGFDGVQIHGANGYIFDQFLRDGSNQRTDSYGGTAANRMRLLCETLDACCRRIGADRVSVRVSPLNPYNDMHDSNPKTLFREVAVALNDLNLAFLEVVEGLPGHFLYSEGGPVLPLMRDAYEGVLIANGGYNRDSACLAIDGGGADAISFGVPFISNPDLVSRFKEGLPLSPADPETFYSPGEPGYLDYPVYTEGADKEGVYQDLTLDEARRH